MKLVFLDSAKPENALGLEENTIVGLPFSERDIRFRSDLRTRCGWSPIKKERKGYLQITEYITTKVQKKKPPSCRQTSRERIALLKDYIQQCLEIGR